MPVKKRKITILLSTIIFPNRFEVTRGVYIQKIAQGLKKLSNLSISVPIPYIPQFINLQNYKFYKRIPKIDTLDNLKVFHPRYFIIPKIFRFLHGPFLFASTYFFYRKLIFKTKPDILLGFWTFPDGFANVLLARTHSIPVVIGCLGSDINHLTKNYIQRKFITWSLHNCNKVLSVSEALKENIAKLGIPKSEIIVIPNGIEADKFYPIDKSETRKKVSISSTSKIILCVSRLSHEKGIDVLLKSFKILPKKNVNLLIIGDGSERDNLTSLSKQLEIDDKVSFLGTINHAEIPLWINSADLMVLPSRTEGWPNVIMEAFSCGIPVVATNVGGVPEIITSRDLGIIVPAEMPEKMAEAMQHGLEKKWNSEIIRNLVKGRSWFTVAQETNKVLEDIVFNNEN